MNPPTLGSFHPLNLVRGISCALCCALALSVAAAEPPPTSTDAPGIDAETFFAAIVKVHARALPDARTARTLGAEREGTGIVIGDNGLIVTIGYLIIEADEVEIVDAHGHTLPARVLGYDHATGLALIRTIPPFAVAPLPMGDSGKIAERDPVLIVTAGGGDDVTQAYVVSKRSFTGSWEYLLEQAIFTSPPALNWSGAALIGTDGTLLGVGSLIVRDATGGDPTVPGNMFVPIDALKPIMSELIKTGRAGPPRPWLGLNADEVKGRLLVTRVSPEGPADRAGVQEGDIVLAVGGENVRSQAEFYRKVWGRGNAGSDIPLRVLQGVDVKELKLHSIDRLDYFKQPTVY